MSYQLPQQTESRLSRSHIWTLLELTPNWPHNLFFSTYFFIHPTVTTKTIFIKYGFGNVSLLCKIFNEFIQSESLIYSIPHLALQIFSLKFLYLTQVHKENTTTKMNVNYRDAIYDK